MERQTHANYLHDLGFLLLEMAQESRKERAWRSRTREFKDGRSFAFMEVLSLMQQQAEVFELPLADLGLPDGFDAERDLL